VVLVQIAVQMVVRASTVASMELPTKIAVKMAAKVRKSCFIIKNLAGLGTLKSV